MEPRKSAIIALGREETRDAFFNVGRNPGHSASGRDFLPRTRMLVTAVVIVIL